MKKEKRKTVRTTTKNEEKKREKQKKMITSDFVNKIKVKIKIFNITLDFLFLIIGLKNYLEKLSVKKEIPLVFL